LNHSESKLRQSSRIVPPDSLLKFGYTPNGGIEFDSASSLLSFSYSGTKKVDVGAFGLSVRDGEGLVVGHSSQLTTGLGAVETQVIGTGQVDGSMLLATFSASTVGQLSFLRSLGATVGSNTAVTSGQALGRMTWFAADGSDYASSGAHLQVAADGNHGSNDTPAYILFATTPSGSASSTERLRIGSGGAIFVNESANANMTVGLTINQDGNDNQILAFKSSDVSHAMTGLAEADTYARFQKANAVSGGLRLEAFKDADGVGGRALVLAGSLGETADTTDTSASDAVVQLSGRKTDGGTSTIAVGATENVASIDNNGTTIALWKGNGDLHVTNTTLVALDDEDDIALVRAYQRESSDDIGVAMTKWDYQMQASRADLIRTGLWSSTGHFTIQQRMNDLLGGAIWQQHTKHMNLAERVDELTIELEATTKKLAALTA
jgi:hypothetical protein